MKAYLENPSIVFTLAIILGLIFPQFSSQVEFLLIPALILSMVLSMREIQFKGRADFRENFSSSVKAFFLNYVALSGLILLLAFIFFSQEAEYFYGLVILAAVPPAVGLVPYTYLLKGNFKISVMGEILCYLLSLLIAPLLVFLFLGTSINILELLKILVLLILFPLIVSRPLTKVKAKFLLNYSKVMVNLSLMVVVYIIVGLNQPILASQPLQLLPLVSLAIIKSLIMGTFLFLFLIKVFQTKKENAISYSLFSVYKNCGAATAIAFSLLGAKAALPATISAIFEVAFLIYFKNLVDKI